MAGSGHVAVAHARTGAPAEHPAPHGGYGILDILASPRLAAGWWLFAARGAAGLECGGEGAARSHDHLGVDLHFVSGDRVHRETL